jgi:hypothetical protein
MTRRNGGSFVLSRRPTAMETEEFLKVNPQLRKWTFSQLMSGGMGVAMQKMTLRGQAFDSLQCGKLVLDKLIKGGAIAGMESIPLSGIDQDADDEINTCDGRHKGRMRAKNHRSNRRSSPPKPCDTTLDFQLPAVPVQASRDGCCLWHGIGFALLQLPGVHSHRRLT